MGKLTLDPSGIQRQSMADPTLLELETAMLKKRTCYWTFYRNAK